MNNLEYYAITIAFFGAVNGLLVIGFDVQLGQTGILNLAYIVFVAIGAYATAIASVPPAAHSSLGSVLYLGGFQWGFPWNMIFGVGVTVIFALIFAGVVFRRLRHDYLALTLITIGSGLLLLITNDQAIFNGIQGISGVPGPFAGVLSNSTWSIAMTLFAVILLAVCFYFLRKIEQAPIGRFFKAIREDEVLLSALSINTFSVKLRAFLLGAAVAGLGGSLLVLFIGGWGTGGWQAGESFALLAALILGGRGNLKGALLGSFILLTVLSEGSALVNLPLAPGIVSAAQQIIAALILLALLWFRPSGLLPAKTERFPSSRTDKTDALSHANDDSSGLGVVVDSTGATQ